jgi:hypothetical protein
VETSCSALGVGPDWVHTKKYGMTTNSVSGEVVLDFMLWPSAKHRFGWYASRANAFEISDIRDDTREAP